MGATMTWDVNGNLISITGATPSGTASNISYSYLSGGQRSEKTVAGVTTQYHYNNGMLLSETTGDETLRYFYDSAGRVASLTYKKGTNAEVGYFFARNYQSDIIAIYRSSDSKLIGTYEYDLWGRPISVTEATAGIDTDGILTKNPFRYRGYYYDSETGFYNLNLRYYDPTICRFISADSMDVLTVETTAVNCKNLFSYCENNPVIARDSTGAFWDTLFDVASLVISVVDVFRNPTNPEAWAGLVGDAVDLCPFVTGVGEAVKGGRLLGKADDFRDATKAAGNAHDATKATAKLDDATGGSSKVLGGSFKDVNASRGADEVAHHLPQNAYNVNELGMTRNEGPALLMSKEDHALTRTYRGKGKHTMIVDKGLNARQRMALDIINIRENFGTKYNEGLLEAIRYAKTLPEFQK